MKMKIFNKFRMPGVALLGTLIGVMSCTSNFDDINTNKSKIADPGPAELPFLFSKALSTGSNNQANYQVAQNLFSDQYAQYFACDATYFPSDRLFIRQDWVGAAFNPIYTEVMPQLLTLMEKYEATTAEHAIANVWWVFAFHKVTDYWGPIPYFKAGEVATSVDYDAQDKIYADFFTRLDASIAVLKTATGTPYADFDLIYKGDITKWLKFANTLKLRLAMRISKVDKDRAQGIAEQAVKDGVFEVSPDDDALVQRSTKGGDGNGLSIMADWNEFRMSASMESVLKGYEDPRISEYFLPALKTGTYEGLRNGLTATQLGDDANKPDALSHAGLRWSSYDVQENKDYDGTNNKLSTKAHAGHLETPQNVMCTAEAYFLRAEGALLGWDMGGTAKDLYEKGITNSMYQWGITDGATISAYLVSTNVPIAPNDYLNSPPMANIPIAFSAAPEVQLEQVMTQKWLALFPEGMEGWADYRRSHVVKLYPVANTDNTDVTDLSTQWIRRIPFLNSEKQSNAAGVATGETLLGGPDNVLTPLWWDKN
jgi:hypothetical protein